MAADASKAELPASANTAPTEAAPPSGDPPGLLTAKAESSQQLSKSDTSVVVDTILLGPDSKLEESSGGTIYVTTSGTKERISEMLYQTFLKQNMKRVASSSIPTGLASQMEEDDVEPIDWGDTLLLPVCCKVLHPCYRHIKPSAPKKMAKLDTCLGSFQPSANVALPEPSPTVTLPDSVTLDKIKETIQNYHDTTVQPSLDILNRHIRQEAISRLERSKLHNFLGSQTLNAIESEQQRRCPAFPRV